MGVQVLLITTNEYEYCAVWSYLRPISGNCLSKYTQFKDDEYAFYGIGKYGECVSAIRKVDPDSFAISNVSLMAHDCFPNLSAIFIVGTISGVSGKVNLFDVLVSSNIFTYEVSDDGHIIKEAKVNASCLFCELFSQPPKWPKADNRPVNHLKGTKPRLHQGTILCGSDANVKSLASTIIVLSCF